MFVAEDPPLPALRSDIQLNEAPPEPEGSPTWTLYDPLANKYYKIGWLEFECLTRFRECRTVGELTRKVRKETTLKPDQEMVTALVTFLINSNLVLSPGPAAAQVFREKKERMHKSIFEKILHGYLFFTLPLFKPQAFLNVTFPYVSFLFTRQFMAGVILVLSYGIFLSFQRIDEFFTTFMSYLNFEGALLLLLTTILSKIVHELGHAYTATKYGVPVTIMGVAFVVMYPMLYTETSNAWKLKNRRDRLIISAGGVMAEIALASVALIMWHILPPGVLQSVCFMIVVVSLGASLAVNLNPLMRFDGYYLFSDMIGVDNLQDRSFSFSKWRLRRWLWGWKDDPPEATTQEWQRFFTVFGYVVWIYRFFLYCGIALLVYHVFFQPLGLILMLVELGFFIALPIVREAKVWVERAKEISIFSIGGMTAVFTVFLMVVSFFPLQRSVEIPAVLHASSYGKIYTPMAAKVEEIRARQGDKVKKDDILFRLSSVSLDYEIKSAQENLKSLQKIRSSSQAILALTKKMGTLDSEIESARQQIDGLMAMKEQLNIRAPYDGVLRDVDPSLHVGQWIPTHMTLALLVNNKNHVLSGYVREKDVARIAAGRKGVFYPEFSPMERYDVVLETIDQSAISEIHWSELSSIFNGPLPAKREASGLIKTLPRHTLYSTKFKIADAGRGGNFPEFIVRGTVRLESEAVSPSSALIYNMISLFNRESGLWEQ